MVKERSIKRIIAYITVLVVIPGMIVIFAAFLPRSLFMAVAVAISLAAVAAFMLGFEKSADNASKAVLAAVFTALSVAGRVVFAATPGFKPVFSMAIFAGMYLGPESGFLVGALTALLSNFIFGQGAWTIFQMFTWGLIGLVAGLLAPLLKKNKVILCIAGALAGPLFSMVIDIWSTVWIFGSFSLGGYLTTTLSALPFTILHAISNVIFLLVLAEPMRRTMDRVTVKYALVPGTANKGGLK
ncbi:MAG: ECF transporter S component [Clostridia bacterium]|nr:ECF transporter S component [Clostridia bacterium]